LRKPKKRLKNEELRRAIYDITKLKFDDDSLKMWRKYPVLRPLALWSGANGGGGGLSLHVIAYLTGLKLEQARRQLIKLQPTTGLDLCSDSGHYVWDCKIDEPYRPYDPFIGGTYSYHRQHSSKAVKAYYDGDPGETCFNTGGPSGYSNGNIREEKLCLDKGWRPNQQQFNKYTDAEVRDFSVPGLPSPIDRHTWRDLKKVSRLG
jgi:hypothetical protein